jgi:DNA-binding NarL/FixJ family response regulator
MKAAVLQPDPRRRVLIVDDHPLVREGLTRVINQQEDLVVCGEAGSAPEGLAAVAERRPDVVIVDISLEDGSGLDLIKDVHARHPGLPMLALSMHHENLYAERALHAGARGYAMKREPVEAVLAALRKILSGQVAVSENIVSRLVAPPGRGSEPAADSPAGLLSDRELEVFRLFGEGCGTRQIAARLHVAVSTVESYRASIKQKLQLGNATELVSHAARFVASEGDDGGSRQAPGRSRNAGASHSRARRA